MRYVTLATVLLLAGCHDLTSTKPRNVPLDAAFADPGIHPVIVVRQRGDVVELDLRLLRGRDTGELGAVQGELTIRQPVVIESLTFASRVSGAWNEVGPGRIRFAVISADSLGHSVLRLTLRDAARLDPRAVRLVLEELVAARGTVNVTSSLRAPVEAGAHVVTSAVDASP